MLQELGVDVRLYVMPGEGHVMRSLFAGAMMDAIDAFRASE